MTSTTPRTQHAAIVGLILVSGFALMRLWALGQSMPGIDYYQFWAVGESIEHDQVTNPYSFEARSRIGSLYLERARASAPDPATRLGQTTRFASAAAARAVLETYSTPFLYTSMHWLASGDYEVDFNRWRVLSLLAFVLSAVAFAKVVGLAWLPTIGILAALLLFFAPLQSETQVLNVNSVQLGALAIVVLLLRRDQNASAQVCAGALLSIAAMFKPNIGLSVVFLLACFMLAPTKRRFVQVAGGIAIGIAFALACSNMFFGSARSWLDWVEAIRSIPPEIITVQMGNYAPLMFAFGEGAGRLGAISSVVLSVPVLAALWLRRGSRVLDDDPSLLKLTTLLGLGCAVFLLSANLVWEHYFILTVPLLITTWVRGLKGMSRSAGERLLDRTLPGVALVCLVATPTYELSGLPHDVYFPLVQGGGVLILYGLALRQLFESREDTTK